MEKLYSCCCTFNWVVIRIGMEWVQKWEGKNIEFFYDLYTVYVLLYLQSIYMYYIHLLFPLYNIVWSSISVRW